MYVPGWFPKKGRKGGGERKKWRETPAPNSSRAHTLYFRYESFGYHFCPHKGRLGPRARARVRVRGKGKGQGQGQGQSTVRGQGER